jgi:hypothetical protein
MKETESGKEKRGDASELAALSSRQADEVKSAA